MKVSDYVIDYLASIGVKHVFLLIGGAVAHLVDSFHDRRDIQYVCVQHEQVAAMAADAYSRVGQNIGVAMATSGPGATNLITGICSAWFDSIATLYITGQVNTYEYKGQLKVRQGGFQETDIVSIVKPITKMAQMVTNPNEIRYYLEKATYIAKSDRPGPVLLDIPMDIQRADIDPSEIKRFIQRKTKFKTKVDELNSRIKDCAQLIEKAVRPVVIAGGGIRNSRATRELRNFVEATGIPVTVTLTGLDSFPHNHQLYAGFLGTYGNRSANFAIANSDLLICIGARFDTRQTGANPRTFAREAKKVVVDIDPTEFNKIIHADIAIQCDAKYFLNTLTDQLNNSGKPDLGDWIKIVNTWKGKYPACSGDHYHQIDKVNPYLFMKTLSDQLADDTIVIIDMGQTRVWAKQTIEVKENQRVFSSRGMSPMGYALPASIGASFYLDKKPIVCIAGDGAFQLNIQELQTIANYNLPIKIFVLNNHGYGLVKQFQESVFDGRYEASEKGYSCPDFEKVANAYGIKSSRLTKDSELKQKIEAALNYDSAVLCNVMLGKDTKALPKTEYGRPIEDQFPYLDREEFLSNMMIKPLEQE